MDLKEIADGLAAKFGIEGLAVEDGEAALEIDGMPILLGEGKDTAVVITGFVGDPPAEGGEAFANLMLEATMSLMDEKIRRPRPRPVRTRSCSALRRTA